MNEIFDTIIIGGGPAAISAGIYAARKKMKSILVTESIGGQSVVSASVENWIGTISISGVQLAQKLEQHLRAQEGIEILTGIRIEKVEQTSNGFKVSSDDGKIFEAKTVIVCTGGRDRRLGVPGEEEFAGRGVAYCSTCDAPFFKNKHVVVVGGGNAGLEAVVDLQSYANEITLLVREDSPQGDPATLEEIKKSSKVEILVNVETTKILGTQTVTGLEYENSKDGKRGKIDAEGVFVEVGVVPNSEIVKDLVKLNDRGEIVIVNPCTGETSKKGVFTAGDVSDERYKQNNIAAGDAIKATLSAYSYLLDKRKGR